MIETGENSSFQHVVETVEALPVEDQVVLVDLIRHRLAEQGRSDRLQEIAESRANYAESDVERGTAADLMSRIIG